MEKSTITALKKGNLPFMEKPAKYRVVVSGRVNSLWASRLGGLVVTGEEAVGNEIISTLEGKLVDQGALSGALTTLNDLQCPLISVEFVHPEN